MIGTSNVSMDRRSPWQAIRPYVMVFDRTLLIALALIAMEAAA